MAESRFSNDEAEAILSRAISIQAEQTVSNESQDLSTRSKLVTDASGDVIALDELHSIALEAGIDVTALEKAVSEHETGALRPLVPCTRSHKSGGTALDRDLPFYLSDEDWMELVRTMRRLSGKQGRFEYVPNTIELIWSTTERSGDINPSYVLSAARGQNGSTVRFELLHSTAVGLYRAFSIGLFLIGAGILMSGTWIAPLVFAAFAVLIWVIGSIEVGRRVERSAKVLDRAVDEIVQRHHRVF